MSTQKPKFSVAGPQWHLVHPSSQGKPLCGEASPKALIGAYVEHVETAYEEVRWVREVFDHNGKPIKACDRCLYLYPSEIKHIIPFSLIITVKFEPDEAFCGYDLKTSAIAQIGDRHEKIGAYSDMVFASAKLLSRLQFGIEVLADAVVPLVNEANRSPRTRQ